MIWITFLFWCGVTLASNPDDHFLQNIFVKYGNKGYLTFEGLEHLMENLGLGHLKFKENHNVSIHKTEDGGFQEVHDVLKLHEHGHNRPRRSYFDKEELKCLSPEELLEKYGLTPDHGVAISPKSFLQICPAMIYQLDTRVCSVEITPEPNTDNSTNKELLVWLYGVSSVVVMSACGLVGVLLVPIIEKNLFQRVLSLLAALAVGTLSGDALLHLLPHALMGAKEEGEIVLLSSATFITLLGFFTIEAAIHGKSHAGKEEKVEETNYKPVASVSTEIDKTDKTVDTSVTAVAWLVITGDGLHNLTDGIAIGAAFRQDTITGLATALAILTHELPHELGDFAVLLKGGMSVKRAVYYNLVSSVLSLLGVVAGLLLGSYGKAALWVYAITAGSFLYISLATLVPEMHKYAHSVPNTLLQLFGMFIGGGIMFLIAMYEHTLHEVLQTSNSN
ncbi:hypothetical protein O3M35_005477 [Rhynocoris fuscipes]|uniref:Zinc transporter ZIP4/12 EF-hand domain-containing protein n=1 Tax=Rhynocoris fuscipes TaxID=488301 RepID=A0AAW1DI95_9HEMI